MELPIIGLSVLLVALTYLLYRLCVSLEPKAMSLMDWIGLVL